MTDVVPVTYISPTAPSFRTRMIVKGENFYLRFKDKQVVLTDPDVIKELDRLIASKPAISQLIQKVDIVAAEKLARAHQKMVLEQNKGVTGSMAADMNPATMARMKEETDRMRTAGVAEEVITELMSDIQSNRDRIDELLEMSDEIPGAVGPPDPDPLVGPYDPKKAEKEKSTPSNVFAALAKND